MARSPKPRTPMLPERFVSWRKLMGWTQAEAAGELDLSIRTIALYEQGWREDTGRPAPIPHSVALACAALAAGIRQYSGPTPGAADIRPRLNVGPLLTASGDLREDVVAWWREALDDKRMHSPIIIMNGFARFDTEADRWTFKATWGEEIASVN